MTLRSKFWFRGEDGNTIESSIFTPSFNLPTTNPSTSSTSSLLRRSSSISPTTVALTAALSSIALIVLILFIIYIYRRRHTLTPRRFTILDDEDFSINPYTQKEVEEGFELRKAMASENDVRKEVDGFESKGKNQHPVRGSSSLGSPNEKALPEIKETKIEERKEEKVGDNEEKDMAVNGGAAHQKSISTPPVQSPPPTYAVAG